MSSPFLLPRVPVTAPVYYCVIGLSQNAQTRTDVSRVTCFSILFMQSVHITLSQLVLQGGRLINFVCVTLLMHHALYKVSRKPPASCTTTLLSGKLPATPYNAALSPLACPLFPFPSTILTLSLSFSSSTTAIRSSIN